jgi:hypothetical protein
MFDMGNGDNCFCLFIVSLWMSGPVGGPHLPCMPSRSDTRGISTGSLFLSTKMYRKLEVFGVPVFVMSKQSS